MSRPWETMPIIGYVKTKPIKLSDGEILESETYPVVHIEEGELATFYVTNKSYEPERKNEPLVIVGQMVEKYTEVKR